MPLSKNASNQNAFYKLIPLLPKIPETLEQQLLIEQTKNRMIPTPIYHKNLRTMNKHHVLPDQKNFVVRWNE